MVDDPIARLLDPSLSEALDFALLMALIVGWYMAIDGTTPTIADARVAEAVDKARITWEARIATKWIPDLPEPPEWLERQVDTHEGM